MSKENEVDKLIDNIDKRNVKKRAYTAVEAASKWLAQERREADESNVFPYSDTYTTKYAPGEDESGYMSSAEGMTALFMIFSKSQEDSTLYLSPRINGKILTDDVEWLLSNDDEQGIEDGVYRATPYLPRDATESFTDAVSFTTTTIQEALKIPKVEISDSRLEEALHLNKEWLVNNYVESTTDTDGIGWAWCGADEMDDTDQRYPPQRYFTYSASVALADLYADPRVETDDEEIERILTRTVQHLLSDYWTEIGDLKGWTEFTKDPYGQGLEPSTFDPSLQIAKPSPFSTSNTLFAAAYLYHNLPDYVWESVDLSEDEENRIHEAIDYLIENVTGQINGNSLEETSAVYKTGATEDDGESTFSRGYTDGSLPYTVLNALLAITNAGGPFDYRQEEIEKLQLATADYILENCWTGDTGFKHFEEDRSEEPVVVYATQLAIESLLWFGIEAPEDDVKNQIIMQLEKTQDKVAALLEDNSDPGQQLVSENSGAGYSSETVLQRSQLFTKRVSNSQRQMVNDFDSTIWWAIDKKLGSEVKNTARKLTNDGLEKELKRSNIFEFFSMLNKCFHANTPSEFEESIQYYEDDYGIFILQPQQEIVNRLQEIGSESVEEFDQRSEIILEILEELNEDPLMDHEEDNVATAFRDKIENLDS